MAVMALQLKYFSPHISTEERIREQTGAALHRQLSFLHTGDLPLYQSSSKAVNQPPDSPLEVSKGERMEPEKDDFNTDEGTTDQPKYSPKEERRQHIQEVIETYWNLAQKTVIVVIEVFWRLLEIYLPKAIIFVVFAAILDEISATHFLILAILVVAIPIEVNSYMYLVLTMLISSLALLKMLYQVPLVEKDHLKFSNCLVSVCLDLIATAEFRIKTLKYNCFAFSVFSSCIVKCKLMHCVVCTRPSPWVKVLHKNLKKKYSIGFCVTV